MGPLPPLGANRPAVFRRVIPYELGDAHIVGPEGRTTFPSELRRDLGPENGLAQWYDHRGEDSTNHHGK